MHTRSTSWAVHPSTASWYCTVSARSNSGKEADHIYLGLIVLFGHRDHQILQAAEKIDLVGCNFAAPAQRFHGVDQTAIVIRCQGCKAESSHGIDILFISSRWIVCCGEQP